MVDGLISINLYNAIYNKKSRGKCSTAFFVYLAGDFFIQTTVYRLLPTELYPIKDLLNLFLMMEDS